MCIQGIFRAKYIKKEGDVSFFRNKEKLGLCKIHKNEDEKKAKYTILTLTVREMIV